MNTKKLTAAFFILGIMFATGALVIKSMPKNQNTSVIGAETVTQADSTQTYALEDILQHSSKDNCWMAIEGKVYDVTKFITGRFHPGGDAILEGCGKDATQLFNTRPMGSGTPHSRLARSMLEKYYIGDLQN